MRLASLLDNVEGLTVARGSLDREVGEVREDSRQVRPGDLFVAVPGTRVDGRRFIAQALDAGAAAILSDARPEVLEALGAAGGIAPGGAASGRAEGATWLVTPGVRRALGIVAANRHGAAAALCLTAVTGTNGKTTTTHVIESMLAAAGRRVGLVGTVGHRFASTTTEAALTTPGALELHRLLAEMRAAGASDVVMEASSIALDQGRLEGCAFRVAGLTNLTQDHLDYHGDMEAYFVAKARLFRERLAPGGGVAVLLIDRPEGRRMRAEVRAGNPCLTVSAGATGADVVVQSRRLDASGMAVTLGTPSGRLALESRLVGDFNLENLLVAVGAGLGHGLSLDAIAAGVASLRPVPGRLERVENDAGVLCVVDYAHTPDALERALAVLRPVTRGRLIVVFGCGGDRDNAKRPLMGAGAARLADLVVVTSDNPRSEDPARILDMIVAGVQKTGVPMLEDAALAAVDRGCVVESDRRRAIGLAVGAARAGDTLLIAGKGHEDYQILSTGKIHLDDREEARAAFEAARGRR
jgi:UDP-N-acetylmuramoyl-L-alanyl-D-glutamate--2,6-diaminopimelate ligase